MGGNEIELCAGVDRGYMYGGGSVAKPASTRGWWVEKTEDQGRQECLPHHLRIEAVLATARGAEVARDCLWSMLVKFGFLDGEWSLLF
jgi:hypothetical protein